MTRLSRPTGRVRQIGHLDVSLTTGFVRLVALAVILHATADDTEPDNENRGKNKPFYLHIRPRWYSTPHKTVCGMGSGFLREGGTAAPRACEKISTGRGGSFAQGARQTTCQRAVNTHDARASIDAEGVTRSVTPKAHSSVQKVDKQGRPARFPTPLVTCHQYHTAFPRVYRKYISRIHIHSYDTYDTGDIRIQSHPTCQSATVK